MKSIRLVKHTPATIAILGGGPAGISCALWCKNLGHLPVLLDTATLPGGTPAMIDRPNRWIAGSPQITSNDLAQNLADHCSQSDLKVIPELKGLNLKKSSPWKFQVDFQTDHQHETLNCSAIVIATGVRPRGIEALPFKLNSEVSESIDEDPLGHLTGKNTHQGESALVIGGADNAFFTTLDLLKSGAKVTLACRSIPKAQSAVQASLQEYIDKGQLTILNSSCSAINTHQEGLIAELHNQNESTKIHVNRIYLRIGFVPRFELLSESISRLNLPLDSKGYPQHDPDGRWSRSGVYCAGDLHQQGPASVVTALGSGARVAKTIEEDLRKTDR